MIGPVLLHLAMTVGGSPARGVSTSLWVCFGIAAGGGSVAVYLFVLGRARLQRPDLERWEGSDEPAWDSPPIAGGIRGDLRTDPLLGRYPSGTRSRSSASHA